jgi:protein-S-isoprenylcysteine O-methyltransferase Ste14
MTRARLLLWVVISVLSTLLLFGLSFVAFALGRGDWVAFFQSPARVGAFAVSLGLSGLAVFSGCGGMNPGKKEDRGNRWIFGPFLLLSLALAVVPAYLDGRNLWAADEAVTPYLGLALLALGGTLRLAAVFVLGRRFTGLVAIQEEHRLETGGLYRHIRHPSYAGILLYMAGYVLVFRCWLGMLLVAATFGVLIARMNAEEALLESEFAEKYAAYRRRTWRLVPWVY